MSRAGLVRALPWVAFVALLVWAVTRRPPLDPTPRAPTAAPASHSWMPPPGVRGLLVLDLARLRSVPSLAPFVTGAAPEAPCELRALAHTRTAAVVFEGPSLDEGAVALSGPLDDAALLACAGAAGAGDGGVRAQAPVRASLYRGLAMRSAGAEAASPRSLVRLDPSLAVYGALPMVQRVVDHQTAPGGPVGDAALAALLALAPSSGAEPAVLLALRGSPTRWITRENAGTSTRALRGVTGVLVRVVLDSEGTALDATLASDDFDSPSAVRDALTALLRELTAAAPEGPLRALLTGVRVERGATHVRVLARMTRAETELALAMLPALVAGEGARPE